MTLVCNLHVSGEGNRFIADLADLYAAALRDLGVEANVLVDVVPEAAPGTVDLVVGPQEWFVVGPDLSHAERLEVASRCVLLTTEQPDTVWWHEQRRWAEVARAVVDLSPLGMAELRRSGVAALHAPVGYHRSLDAWHGGDDARDVDVAFLGSVTDRRLAIIGGAAGVLAHRRCRLLFHDPLVPVTEAGPSFVSGADKAALLARSRVLLNVHRGGQAYFEWVRAIEAMSNGALLLTEPSAGYEPLSPMAHFVPAQPELLAAHLTALLADEPHRAKLAGAAYDFVRTELLMSDLLAVEVLPLLDDVASGRPAVLPDVPPAPPIPAPPGPAGPPPGLDLPARVALKRAVLAEQDVARRLARLEITVAGGDPDAVGRRATPAWEAAAPAEVSVVTPLFDAEGTVLEALRSAVASRHVATELIVVDDASGDGSRAAVEAFMDQHPDVPILLLARAANVGPSVARNLGIEHARTDRCFLLDADNVVHPPTLRKLSDLLDATGAAFAYGILEVFGDEVGLVSAMPWSVDSLVRRLYIDAMGLLSKPAWAAVGGFRAGDEIEDYSLWLRLAAAGYEGAWLPEVVGRYRRHQASRTSVTALDPGGAVELLRQELTDLPWPPR
jgi:hypothetical protein